MDQNTQIDAMLELLLRPGFCVRSHVIVKVNQAAAALGLRPGDDVRPMLATGAAEYEALDRGCLFLKLDIPASASRGASVLGVGDGVVFALDPSPEEAGAHTNALAARELRMSLQSALTALERLDQNPQSRAQMEKSLYRMLRLVGNLSDAQGPPPSPQRVRNATRVFDEMLQKAQALLSQAEVPLTYTGPEADIYTLMNAQQVERAVLNILSNAAKFSPRGAPVRVELVRQGRMLRLSVTDSGPGIPEPVRATLFSRYLRPLTLEDPRHGVGLGMALIRSAATDHGGAVLVDQPPDGGTRVTMTLAIRQPQQATLRSPILPVDYLGELDQALVELSDVLPLSAFIQEPQQ